MYCALPLYHSAGGAMAVGAVILSRAPRSRCAAASARARSGTTCAATT